jgi:tRNA pseudouridine13 synthase
MRYKVQPEDFAVEECIRLPLASGGRFAVYRVRKRGVTTLRVQAWMARALGVPHSAVVFPALKDRDAVAVQHVAVRGTGPARLAGDGFVAEFVGRSPRALTPADIVVNRFTVVLRDLSDEEATRIDGRLAQVARFGLPNYFDEQRFGSLAPGEVPIGKRILQRDAEGALRAYLSQRFAGDPAPVRAFKAFAADHWVDWDALFDAAPRPSNFRSVLTYLRDHPTDDPAERATHHRKALNLVTRRLLSLHLAAYQSLLWNRIAARYLVAHVGEIPFYVEIAGERLPLYHELPPCFDCDVAIPLPHHRAAYISSPPRSGGSDDHLPSPPRSGESGDHLASLPRSGGSDDHLASPPRSGGSGGSAPTLNAIVARILADEGLALSDLKARILKRAYLSKGQRALLLFPQETSASLPEPDDRFPGQHKLTLTFTLPRGSYATLVLKTLSP